MAEGKAYCWRCLKEGKTKEEAFIPPDTPPDQWDLGHDDKDRSITRGPEHVRCNRGTASRRPQRRRKAESHPGLTILAEKVEFSNSLSCTAEQHPGLID